MPVSPPAHATPESAAMASFPAAHCRVVASAVDGDDAYVVLDTGPGDYRYLYGVSAVREAGGWWDGTGGNGPAAGWTLADEARELGTAYVYGEAPAGATHVRCTLGAEAREAPVVDGVYLVAWWRVPADAPMPTLTAFEVGGAWTPAGPWP